MERNYSEIVSQIREIVAREEAVLAELAPEVVTERYNIQNRNIKMLLGHLVDSASNNQQRMVRLQYAPRCGYSMPDANVGMLVFPDYTQDNDLWISLQDYRSYDWQQLIQLWKYANLHIAHIIEAVDQSKLDNYWIDYQGNRCTLDQMIRGYVDHLKLHMGQIHELMAR
ncbi:MAG: DinB family protein [Bacteroidales bacterium]|nr:DinB family protein [Bacteroidales bacterium]